MPQTPKLKRPMPTALHDSYDTSREVYEINEDSQHPTRPSELVPMQFLSRSITLKFAQYLSSVRSSIVIVYVFLVHSLARYLRQLLPDSKAEIATLILAPPSNLYVGALPLCECGWLAFGPDEAFGLV